MTAPGLKPVAITGGSIHEARLHGCILDALALTQSEKLEGFVHLRLKVVSRDSAPPAATGASDTGERLPAKVIKAAILAHFPRFRACYVQGLQRDPTLAGDVSVEFVIDASGQVIEARLVEAKTTLPDPAVSECVRAGYEKIWFPEPVGGKVKVTYPIKFEIDDPS